jgi:hypothetical protein
MEQTLTGAFLNRHLISVGPDPHIACPELVGRRVDLAFVPDLAKFIVLVHVLSAAVAYIFS